MQRIEERIIKFIKKNKKKRINVTTLREKLKISREKLVPILKELSREGAVFYRENKVRIVRKGVRYRGKIQIKKGRYGFVLTEDGPDIFVPGRYLKNAMDGDRVEVEIYRTRREKNLEGKVIKIIERERQNYVGTVIKDWTGLYVMPDAPQFPVRMPVSGSRFKLRENLRVLFVPDIGARSCFITEELGHKDDPEVDYKVVIKKFGLKEYFSQSAIKEAEKFPSRLSIKEFKNRCDYRDTPVWTIDPETAKDFDDAISAQKTKKGYKIGIHIADVSHYVFYPSHLFDESFKRGTSVYLLDRVIPMLPFVLSADLCSLKPGRNRFTISVIIELDKKGNVISYEVKKGIIKSEVRLNYREAQAIIDGKIHRRYKGSIVQSLRVAGEIACLLRQMRQEKESLDFDRPEPELLFDREGNVREISRKYQSFSHNLIEEFMILANKLIAQFLEKKGHKLIYRVHEEPDPKKLRELALTLSFVIKEKLPDRLTISEIRDILDKVRGSRNEDIVSLLILRAMKQARYSPENVGHYGLGLERYTHFTSPIRRFPDLVIHHLVAKALKNEDGFNIDTLLTFAERASERERIAQQAEWEILDLKTLDYLKNEIGNDFQGIISKVTGDGFYVKLDNYFIEAFVPITELKGRFRFIRKQFALVSPKKRYQLGDEIRIRLIRCIKERKILQGMPL